MKKTVPLSERLIHVIDLRIPGFYKSVPPGRIGQLSFSSISCEEWYYQFTTKIFESIGKRYYPVYRMADGEFIFCVGFKPALSPITQSNLKNLWLKAVAKVRNVWHAKNAGTCWGENYSERERDSIFQDYVRNVRKISEEGALAIHFTRTNGRFSEEYFSPMCDWFEQNGIEVNPDNYFPFYFVYALLNGPGQALLYAGRRVLIVSNFKNKNRTLIERRLLDIGAVDVQFMSISHNKAMMEKIDLSYLVSPVDLVLVAAGTGSANIMAQLKPLKTVCIDAGACIDYLGNRNLMRRNFCVPDNELEK